MKITHMTVESTKGWANIARHEVAGKMVIAMHGDGAAGLFDFNADTWDERSQQYAAAPTGGRVYEPGQLVRPVPSQHKGQPAFVQQPARLSDNPPLALAPMLSTRRFYDSGALQGHRGFPGSGVRKT